MVKHHSCSELCLFVSDMSRCEAGERTGEDLQLYTDTLGHSLQQVVNVLCSKAL